MELRFEGTDPSSGLVLTDGDMLEVHVRIQYTGAAERFAWMVPLPAVPEVEIGVDALFDALSDAT